MHSPMRIPATWSTGFRGALVAALLALAAGLPPMILLPPLEGEETRTAQSSAQMLDGHGLTLSRLGDEMRPSAPPGAHWAQAVAVKGTASQEARRIWAFRLPSLLACALAAALLVLGGARLFGGTGAFTAGALFGASALSVTLSSQATSNGLFLAAMSLALASLGALYLAARSGDTLRRRHRLLFWGAVIAGVLIKGPLSLTLPGLTLIVLGVADRRWRWMGSLGWSWGLLALAAAFGAWLSAAAVETDGRVFTRRWLLSDEGGHGLQTALLPLLFFPAAFALPFAAVHAWRERASAGVRLALAWLVPAWVLLELLPGQSAHGAAALYPPLFWLAGAGLTAGGGRAVRLAGTAVACAVAAGGVLLGVRVLAEVGAQASVMSVVAAVLVVSTGLAGAWSALRGGAPRTIAATLVIGLAAQWFALGVLAPRTSQLWPAQGVVAALQREGLDPRNGLARGPVALSGRDSTSLLFALGEQAEPGGLDSAVRALADRRPAIMDGADASGLEAALGRAGVSGERVVVVKGYDVSRREPVTLVLYAPGG